MRKLFRRLRFVLNIHRFVPFLLDFFASKEVPIRKKLVSILLVVVYTLIPFDAIPDFIPFAGFLDDLTFLTFMLQQIVKMAPKQLRDKYQLFD